jgi:ribulose-phosphate 3-epimerase
MCADFLNLKDVVDTFVEEDIDYLHMDIMDGHYTPNFTLGVGICKTLYEYSHIPLDIHLMVINPDDHVDTFSPFKGSVLAFHPEMSLDPASTLRRIEDAGLRPGIVVRPDLPLDQVKPLLPYTALINIMTVYPGFAGQRLVPETIGKLSEAAEWTRHEGMSVEVEVDGNVSWKNAPLMHEAGAQVFVTGSSSIFSTQGSLRDNIRRFRRILSSHAS